MTAGMVAAPFEELLALHIRAFMLPVPCREYRFDETRRWRFDFAWPQWKVAAEVEGGTGFRGPRGRHVRPAGFEADAEKYNAAAAAGWKVLRFTVAQVRRAEAVRTIEQVLQAEARR